MLEEGEGEMREEEQGYNLSSLQCGTFPKKRGPVASCGIEGLNIIILLLC